MSPKKRAKEGKERGPMDRVLFVRAPADLIAEIDRVVDEERRAEPGITLSRSDVIRVMLYEALRGR